MSREAKHKTKEVEILHQNTLGIYVSIYNSLSTIIELLEIVYLDEKPHYRSDIETRYLHERKILDDYIKFQKSLEDEQIKDIPQMLEVIELLPTSTLFDYEFYYKLWTGDEMKPLLFTVKSYFETFINHFKYLTKTTEDRKTVQGIENRNKLSKSIQKLIAIKNERKLEKEILMSKPTKSQILFINEDGLISHKDKGALSFNYVGGRIPKYYTLIKNIIGYFPLRNSKIRISDFEKNIDKKSRLKDKKEYRSSLGKSAKPLLRFFKKNNIPNFNKSVSQEIISATDDYIIFNNYS